MTVSFSMYGMQSFPVTDNIMILIFSVTKFREDQNDNNHYKQLDWLNSPL